ncbi:CMP-N-acetylneuraminate-beta-galactosamide-alpha-2,3-sialyltransferase 2-like [Oscarella lobularis]|uniref:CMP-N-acetylneuraminate-beta-galactosamide- alpha-2,3-sialyltransferase 2-like n=1 Tax=Oscarella lobularis TaxID=121494 RepID=UPI003313BF83
MPSEEEFNRYPQLRYRKSCALVGFSGNLLNFELGKEIDSRDVIIHMNDASFRGYEKHAGSRTDVQIMNLSGFTGPDVPRDHPLLLINSIQGMNKKNTRIAEECKRKYGRKVYSASDLLRHVPDAATSQYGKRYASSARHHLSTAGMKGLFFSLLMCDIVHVYGFGLSKSPSDRFHYYSAKTVKEMTSHTAHDWSAERKVFDDFSKNKFNWAWLGKKEYDWKAQAASVVLHGQPLL